MSKNQKNEHVISEEMLNSFEVGHPIARFGFFINLTFQGIENDKVHISDCNGDVKQHPVWLFLKHARVAK
jgi:hypothetical protein